MPYFTRFMLIMLLVTVACEPESESGAAFPMDGEGDTVRVLTIDLTDEVDVVRVIPLASIGAAEGTVEETLYGAYSGFLDAAGRVVVANSRGPDVREYSLDGQFIRLFGRSGRGPGEFIQAGRIVQLVGDSLLVYDPRLLRFSVFDREGNFARSFTIEGIGLRGRQPNWIRHLPTGDLLLAVSTGLPTATMMEGRPARDSINITRAGTSNGNGEVLFSIPNRWWEDIPNPSAFDLRAFNGPFAVVATDGETLFYSSNDAPAIYLRSLADPSGITKWELMGIEPAVDSESPREYGTRYLEQILVSNSGNIWISQSYTSENGTRVWYRLDADGRPDASMTLPQSMRILQIAEPVVLARQVDSLGVEYMRILRIQPSS